MLWRHGGIGVVHIPKAAGTSLRLALSESGLLTESDRYHDPHISGLDAVEVRGPEWAELVYSIEELRSALDTHPVVMGHIALGTFLEAGARKCWIIVREPRSRLLSLYDHFLRLRILTDGEVNETVDVMEQAVSRDLDHFLDFDGIDSETDNVIARMVLPSMLRTTSKGHEDPERFRAAVHQELGPLKRRIAGVVWSVDLDAEIETIVKRIDGRCSRIATPAVPFANASPDPDRDALIDEVTTKLLDRRTWRTSIVLDELMDLGLLRRRSAEDLDREFATTAARHGYRFS